MTVYQELREGEVIRSATFDQITHFTADNKYVVAHFAGGQILLKDTLVELQAAHPELLKVHRSTLVKVDGILSAGRARNSYSYCLKVKGFAGDLPLSRRMYPVVNKFIRGGKPRKGIVTAAETEALLGAALGREAALQERLNVADQRVDELEGLLREWRHGQGMTLKDCASLRDRTDGALKPAAWKLDMDYRPEELGSPETEPVAQHHDEPTAEQLEAGCQAYMEADGIFLMHPSSMGHAYKAMRALEQPAPVAPFKPDTVVCRRYTLEQHPGQNFYHYDLEPAYGSVPVTISDLIKMVEATPVALVMPELNNELRDILGKPNFTCHYIAQTLRFIGYEIKKKSEDEQAVTIYWMLGHYLKDPAAWRDNAQAELKAAADRSSEEKP